MNKKKKKRRSKRVRPEETFSTEDLILQLMDEKGYQAREARMVVKDILELLDTPIIENKNIVFRGHFVLKKKSLSTRLVSNGIIRHSNPTMPLADKIIVARRYTYKFVPATNLRKRIKEYRMLKDKDFKVMLSDQK